MADILSCRQRKAPVSALDKTGRWAQARVGRLCAPGWFRQHRYGHRLATLMEALATGTWRLLSWCDGQSGLLGR